MKVDMQFEGLQDLIHAFNQLASEDEIENVDKRIISEAEKIVHRVMKQKIPLSKDNSLSGRGLKGGGVSRPKHGHAKENIPISKPKKMAKGVGGFVGWKLNDNSEYFYMKFVLWGTLYTPPKDFIDTTLSQTESQFSRIAEAEYQRFLNQYLR